MQKHKIDVFDKLKKQVKQQKVTYAVLHNLFLFKKYVYVP